MYDIFIDYFFFVFLFGFLLILFLFPFCFYSFLNQHFFTFYWLLNHHSSFFLCSCYYLISNADVVMYICIHLFTWQLLKLFNFIVSRNNSFRTVAKTHFLQIWATKGTALVTIPGYSPLLFKESGNIQFDALDEIRLKAVTFLLT